MQVYQDSGTLDQRLKSLMTLLLERRHRKGRLQYHQSQGQIPPSILSSFSSSSSKKQQQKSSSSLPQNNHQLLLQQKQQLSSSSASSGLVSSQPTASSQRPFLPPPQHQQQPYRSRRMVLMELLGGPQQYQAVFELVQTIQNIKTERVAQLGGCYNRSAACRRISATCSIKGPSWLTAAGSRRQQNDNDQAEEGEEEEEHVIPLAARKLYFGTPLVSLFLSCHNDHDNGNHNVNQNNPSLERLHKVPWKEFILEAQNNLNAFQEWDQQQQQPRKQSQEISRNNCHMGENRMDDDDDDDMKFG